METKNAKLIKIDRNGSKHYEGLVECDRCQGRGWFAIGSCNGQLVPSHVDNAVCYKCHGERFVPGKWIERTPEYQAKLDARRAKKLAEEQAKLDAERAAREAEEARIEAAKEEARKAEEDFKALLTHVGTPGEKLTIKAVYVGSPHYERKAFGGYGTETCYIHTFKDENGNKLVWKTGSGLHGLEEGSTVELTGTVKEHGEYKGEKQTSLIRCKVKFLYMMATDYEEAQERKGTHRLWEVDYGWSWTIYHKLFKTEDEAKAFEKTLPDGWHVSTYPVWDIWGWWDKQKEVV